jgi:hypothetical protein
MESLASNLCSSCLGLGDLLNGHLFVSLSCLFKGFRDIFQSSFLLLFLSLEGLFVFGLLFLLLLQKSFDFGLLGLELSLSSLVVSSIFLSLLDLLCLKFELSVALLSES